MNGSRAARIILVIAFAVVFALSVSSFASAQTSGLSLVCPSGAHWGSYAEYQVGLLTVDYGVVNAGPGQVYNATLMTATANNDVDVSTLVPIWMGDLDPDTTNGVTVKWTVPSGVPSFRTTLSICSDCSEKICVGEEEADGGGLPDPNNNGGINIKPGSCPNSLNLNGGDVAVAVYSYQQFNPLSLDDSTVTFMGASPYKYSANTDLNYDNVNEVIYHFYRSELGLQVGDNRACLSATITGDGAYRSCDMVRIVGG